MSHTRVKAVAKWQHRGANDCARARSGFSCDDHRNDHHDEPTNNDHRSANNHYNNDHDHDAPADYHAAPGLKASLRATVVIRKQHIRCATLTISTRLYVMTVEDAAAAVQVAARIEAYPAAVDTRAGARNTAAVGSLQSICGPTGRDVFPVDTPRKRPTSER
jgi:ABC-type Zn2+ transport system substrate-binding protein/surface adhesin